jgi:hypothetical protein
LDSTAQSTVIPQNKAADLTLLSRTKSKKISGSRKEPTFVIVTIPIMTNYNQRHGGHSPVASSNMQDDDDDGQNEPSSSKSSISRRRFSVIDLVNPHKPWILMDGGPLLGFFGFVPRPLRESPWSVTASLALFVIVYVVVIGLLGANMMHTPSRGESIMDDFVLANDAYKPYTHSWYYNVFGFFWMTFVAYMVFTESPLSWVAWVSFTLWSWTIMIVRHGLCVLAPFVPSVRVAAEMLRLPVLLSASITFGVWNFVLMPAICIFFIKDTDRRWKFIKFATGFRLTQLHVCNIVFAVLNGAWSEPRRPLHLGDLNVLFVYVAFYMFFYYFVLDRLQIHLYPIFSPRVSWVIFSWLLVLAICLKGYSFWWAVLAPNV